MNYTTAIGREFWYDFDNQTLWQRTPAVSEAVQKAYFSQDLTLDSAADEFRASYARSDHPQQFVSRVEGGRDGFLALFAIQYEIIGKHLDDAEALRRALVDFGQGILFDDRPPRPASRKVHAMDGTPDNWVGWQRWYAAIRAAVELGADRDKALSLARCIGLGWGIQTEAAPSHTSPNNPGLAEARINALSAVWMTLDFTVLDRAFAKNQFRAPEIASLEEQAKFAARLSKKKNKKSLSASADTEAEPRYAKVQEILDTAAGPAATPMHTSEPDGVDRGRFWRLPYSEFMALPSIYGQQLIAEPGAERGERSGLVQILRGTLAGFPRMPLNRPPVADPDIAFISQWIDDGCPEI